MTCPETATYTQTQAPSASLTTHSKETTVAGDTKGLNSRGPSSRPHQPAQLHPTGKQPTQ